MSLRRRLARVATRAIDRVYAETGTITFMANGDAHNAAGPDQGHPPLALVLVRHDEDVERRGEGERRETLFESIWNESDVVLRAERDAFATARLPRPGDRIETADGARWAVKRAHDDEVARVLIAVTPLGGGT